MNQKIIWISIIIAFILVSTTVLLHTDYPIHHELHTISTFIAIILAGLAFRGYINYKITRLLFSGFAFLAFGISEGIEVIYDLEYHGEVFSASAIRDYVIIVGLSLFAFGTIPKK
jgi:hypothetical protein